MAPATTTDTGSKPRKEDMNTRRFVARAGLTGAAALFAAAGFAGQAYASSQGPLATAADTPTVGSDVSPDLASGTFTASIPGCTSHGTWLVHPGVGGYAEAKWTSNPCGFRLEVRAWCENAAGTDGHWSTSGVVLRTGMEDRASCSAPDSIRRGELRAENGNNWSTYRTFWTA
jgi:hypothetical protein